MVNLLIVNIALILRSLNQICNIANAFKTDYNDHV